jgi:orotate phosphoribosyltransferase
MTEIADLFRRTAVVHEPVVLSSGGRSDWYVDTRRLTLSGSTAALIGSALLDLTADWAYTAVGGLSLGADPVAMAMMHSAIARGRHLDAFIVRKEAKAHGLNKTVEGPQVCGRRVLVVEDVSTTGHSSLLAVERVRTAGGEVVGVAALVDRGGSAAISAAGLEFRCLVATSELIG